MAWPPRFAFVGSTLALDFIQTGGKGFRARWEGWHSPSDLADWAELSPDLGFRPRASEDDLILAHQLREALWFTASRQLEQQPPDPADLALIEAIASGPSLRPMLRDGHRLWQPAGFGEVMSSVARDAIDLFGTARLEHFRKCANPNCFLMFVDTSRPGKRKWCTMMRCGNLSKAARHRAKKSEHGSDQGEDHAH